MDAAAVRRQTEAMHPASSTPLGLIAGAGEFPRLVARGARDAGRPVCIIALRGSAEPDLRSLADRFAWAGVARVGSWIRTLRRAGCREVIMAGRVRKAKMFAGPRWLQWLTYAPDLTSIRLWYFHMRDRRNDSLLGAIADELGRKGLTLIDSTSYCPEALAAEGLLGSVQPSRAALADVDFAWPLARQIAALDIGQALAVKEREIIAVEAIEGTDALIERSGQLCRAGGWTLVKVAKPQQDMRFDVPTIGPLTIEHLHRQRAACLVIEAGRTLVLEREKTVALANKYGIAVLARKDPAAS